MNDDEPKVTVTFCGKIDMPEPTHFAIPDIRARREHRKLTDRADWWSRAACCTFGSAIAFGMCGRTFEAVGAAIVGAGFLWHSCAIYRDAHDLNMLCSVPVLPADGGKAGPQ